MMTKHEFAEIMAILSAAIDKPIGKPTLAIWYEILKDLPGGAVAAAVHTIIATDEYPVLPSVGKIRKTTMELTAPARISGPEAWGATIEAVKHYGHGREKEALESLPAEAAQVARMMGWREMCQAENVEVIRGQYLRMYDTQETRAKRQDLLPPRARELIAETTKKLSLPEGREPDGGEGT